MRSNLDKKRESESVNKVLRSDRGGDGDFQHELTLLCEVGGSYSWGLARER